MLMLVIVGAAVGYALGLILKSIFFEASGGASWVASFVIAFVFCIICVLGLSIFAELRLGAQRQPSWVGGTAFFFAWGLFVGVKRRK